MNRTATLCFPVRFCLVIIAAALFWGIGIYNRLINERNRVKNAFAQIDVQLTRDGTVAVMHDPDVDRTTDSTQFIEVPS